MKNELREKYLMVRKNITERDKLDEIIYNKVISNLQIINSSGVLIYVSLDDEVDTIRIINYLLSKKKLVAIPRVEGNTMNFYYINSLEDTHMGKFGILEPNGCERVKDYSGFVSITPGVCYTKDGYRIGYGGGYYNRFYKENNVYKIGLCYMECLISDKFMNEYDQKVDEIITD